MIHSQNGVQILASDEPPSTLPTSSMSPSSLSNAGATRAAISAQPSSPNGGLPPLFVVLICATVLTSFILLYVRRRIASRQADQSISAYFNPIARGRRKNEGDPANGRPEMFDAWTERCASNSRLKWEEYMVSATASFRVSDLRRSWSDTTPF